MVSGVILIAALLMAVVLLTYRLGDFRVDIEPGVAPFGGRSRIWQANVLRWSNYRPDARPLLIALYALIALLGFGIGGLVLYLWARA